MGSQSWPEALRKSSEGGCWLGGQGWVWREKQGPYSRMEAVVEKSLLLLIPQQLSRQGARKRKQEYQEGVRA